MADNPHETKRWLAGLWLPIFLTALLTIAGIHEFKHRDELTLRYQDQVQLNILLIRQTEEQEKYIAVLKLLMEHYQQEAERKSVGQWAGVP